MEAVLEKGVDLINDITALKDPKAISLLKDYKVPVVIMHSRNTLPRAEKKDREHIKIMDEILTSFQERKIRGKWNQQG